MRKLTNFQILAVILIGHSYGGLPITEALKIKGVIKADRQKEGKKGGLVRLAYMTGIVAPVGSSATDILGDMPEENRVDFVTRVSLSFLLSSFPPLIPTYYLSPPCRPTS